MQTALRFQSQCRHSQRPFLSVHIVKAKSFLLPSNNLPIIASEGSSRTRKRFPSRSIFSRKKKKKQQQQQQQRSGSRRLTRFALKLIPIIASNLKVSARPLHLIAEELGGGDGSGGGLGFWGGSGWEWFDGRSRGGGRKLGFWVVVLVACGLSLMFVGEMEGIVACRILGLGLLGLGLIEGWSKKKGTSLVKNRILGICFLGAVSFWGLRKEEARRKSWGQGLSKSLRRPRRRPGKFW